MGRGAGVWIPCFGSLRIEHAVGVLIRSLRTLDSGGNIHVFDAAAWRRDRCAILSKSVQMESDGFTDLCLSFLDGAASGNATWKIRDTGGIVGRGLLDADCVAHDVTS